MMLRPRAVIVAWMTLAACAPPITLGTTCDFNSDCPASLVCGHGRCRAACRVSRDCGPGLRCVVGNEGTTVCSLPEEERCGTSDACPATLECASGECRTPCGPDVACTDLGVCRDGTCAEPVSGQDAGVIIESDAGPPCVPAPMVCGDGTLQACDGERHPQLLDLLVGSSLGELEFLAPHTFAPTTRPRTAAIGTFTPQVALGASAALAAPGFGVIGWIDGGADGTDATLVLQRFPLDDLGAAAPVSDLFVPGGVRSIALAEDGSDVVGFAILSPESTSDSSASVITIPTSGPASATSLSSSGPSSARGRATIIGGTSGMLGTTFPRFMVNRHDGPTEAGGERVLGAVDAMNSYLDYRVVTTTGFSSDAYLETAGSPGNAVIVRDSLFGLGIWHPRITMPYMLGGPIGMVMPLGGIAREDVLGTPAIALADAGGIDHLIAYPAERGAGEGETRFARVLCPLAGACGAATPLAAIRSTTGLVPTAVAMARVDSGYAYAAIEPTASGARIVQLRYIDENGSDVPLSIEGEPPPPILPPRARAEEIVSDVQIHATRGADAVTVIVAIAIRDEARTQDTVWIGGVRACLTR